MKIKFYKLLEMIDKEEELPEKIKVAGKVFRKSLFGYNDEDKYKELFEFLFYNYTLLDIANEEIEIVENDEDVEDTKTLKPFSYNDNTLITSTGNHYTLRVIDKIIMTKINEIIKYINKEE